MRPIRDANSRLANSRLRRCLVTVTAIAAAATLVPALAGADYPRPEKIDRALAAQDDLAQRLYPGARQPTVRPEPSEVVAQPVAAPNSSEAVVEWLSRWGPVDSREIP
jgi:hypothetical protein